LFSAFLVFHDPRRYKRRDRGKALDFAPLEATAGIHAFEG